MDLTCEQRLRLLEMIDDYKVIDEYRRKRKVLNYVQFDYDVVHGLTLFTLDPDFSFADLEARADVVLSALPAIKRIFEQPFIHLKEHDVIMPVEAVRIVNNATLTHIASHSELWANVENNEIKPEKLLTRTYEDNYGIYENLVFCNVVDSVLSFARGNTKFLKELIYTNQTIEINLLERVNHLNYFLALGKLHIGYSKNFDTYYAVALRCLNKLQYILSSIVPRLKRPVYRSNKNRPATLKIRKTNILSMHKEYHRVYKLAKYFARQTAPQPKQIDDASIKDLQKNYYFFCQALCVFALGHFNFSCDERKLFDFEKIMPRFMFKNWAVDLKPTAAGATRVIELRVEKDKPYTVVLIPSVDDNNKAIVEAVKIVMRADEYVILSPFEEHERDAVHADIANIESFRRLQQIILRGMIYSDTERKDCPFCNNDLTVNAEKSSEGNAVYECGSCRTEIHDSRCALTDKPFSYTKIVGLKPPQADGETWLTKRNAEGGMYFRNITEIDAENDPVCPHCGTVCQAK